MASKIDDIRAKVITRIQDSLPVLSVTAGGAVDTQILAALGEYQRVRPRERTKVVTGTGGFDYALDGSSKIVTDWVDGLSSRLQVVFPWDATGPNPQVLEDDETRVVRLEAGIFLRFANAKPAATDQFLFSYTTSHTLDGTTSTVSPADDEALSDLAAAYCCDAMAMFFSQTVDNSIQADTVNRIAKADSYRSSAKNFRASYRAKMFADAPTGPASAVGSFDSVYSNDVDRFFFHGRRFR